MPNVRGNNQRKLHFLKNALSAIKGLGGEQVRSVLRTGTSENEDSLDPLQVTHGKGMSRRKPSREKNSRGEIWLGRGRKRYQDTMQRNRPSSRICIHKKGGKQKTNTAGQTLALQKEQRRLIQGNGGKTKQENRRWMNRERSPQTRQEARSLWGNTPGSGLLATEENRLHVYTSRGRTERKYQKMGSEPWHRTNSNWKSGKEITRNQKKVYTKKNRKSEKEKNKTRPVIKSLTYYKYNTKNSPIKTYHYGIKQTKQGPKTRKGSNNKGRGGTHWEKAYHTKALFFHEVPQHPPKTKSKMKIYVSNSSDVRAWGNQGHVYVSFSVEKKLVTIEEQKWKVE